MEKACTHSFQMNRGCDNVWHWLIQYLNLTHSTVEFGFGVFQDFNHRVQEEKMKWKLAASLVGAMKTDSLSGFMHIIPGFKTDDDLKSLSADSCPCWHIALGPTVVRSLNNHEQSTSCTLHTSSHRWIRQESSVCFWSPKAQTENQITCELGFLLIVYCSASNTTGALF